MNTFTSFHKAKMILFSIVVLLFCNVLNAHPLVDQHNISSSLPGYVTLSLQINDFSTNDIDRVSLIIEDKNGIRKGSYSLTYSSSGMYEISVESENIAAGDSYFFQLQDNMGEVSYYPDVNSGYAPLSISEDDESDDGLPVEIISPDPNSQVLQDEVTIAVSYMGLEDQVASDKIKLLIDDMDVSKYLEINDDFFVITPPKLRPGKHKVRIMLYKNDGTLLGEKKFSFQVIATAISEMTVTRTDKNIRGRAFANYRSQSIMGNKYSYNYLYSGVRLTGQKEKLDWNVNVLYSNQDKKSRQPVNQYGAGFIYRPFKNSHFKLNAGDMFTRYDDLFFMGIRNRGVELEARLKFLSVTYLQGKISRSITEARDTSNYVTRLGVYERDVSGIMPALHFGNVSTTKFYYLHFKDDMKSVETSTSPQENTLFGVSQVIRAHQNRIMLNFQAAASLLNRNITSGDIPTDSIVNAFDLDKSAEKWVNRAKKFITVNEYMVANVPFALKGNLILNYMKNSLTFDYRYIQDGFTSFGNPYLLKDISGFSLYDRIQIIQGKTYLTLQYENLKSQMADDFKEPLKLKRLGFAINYYPGNNYPSLSLGYTNHSRNNSMESDSLKIYTGEDNSINQFYANSNYKIMTGNLNHSINLNFSNYIKTNNLADTTDNSSQTISGGVKTNFNKQTYSRVFFTYNTSDIAKGSEKLEATFKTSSFGFQVGHQMNNVFRDDILNFNVQYYYSKKDYNRYSLKQLIGRNTFGANIAYNIKRNGRINLSYQLSKYGNDVSYSDHFILAGYEVRF